VRRGQMIAVLAGVACLATLSARQKEIVGYPIAPVPLQAVRVTGGFWQARLETNRTVTIPHIMQENETTGRVDNFRKGAGLMPGDYSGRRFNDTDIYKIVEAAAYTLVAHPDPALSKKLDDLIDLIAKSQQPDGYLFPARTINPQKPAPGVGTERWEYENTGSHELYDAGHLYDAAVAHFLATGERNLLDVAIKNANLVRATFGPTARRDAPGHEVIEMALVRLYAVTTDARYFDLAKFFLDERGTDHHASKDYTEPSWQLYNDRAYRQDDTPVVEQERAEGHAVRAVYLYSAMADMAGMLRDGQYDSAIDRLWQDVYSKRAYLTGGLGSVGGTEAFADDYVLPNRTAYTETCASVGGILWNHRMFLKSGAAKYLDAFEQTLYNGFLSGVSIAGDTFFYQNPLEATATSRNNARSAYFDVACCPANLARLMAQLPGLIYAQRQDELFVNLFVDSSASVTLASGTVNVAQHTRYPWDGKVSLDVNPAKAGTFTLSIRRPGWLAAGPFASDLYRFSQPVSAALTIRVNGQPVASTGADRGWITIARRWAPGDRVDLDLPMPVRRVLPNPGITEDAGKSAIQRGPVVYALEGIDNGGKVSDIAIPADAVFTPVFRADLLGGVETLTTSVPFVDGARSIVAIPYFAWANRGRGEMVVWVRNP
jgi:uncharacterized protein